MRLIALLLFVAQFAVAQPTTILAERARAQFVDEVLEDRFTNLLPQLMRREGIDMWVIISREYNRSGGPRRPCPENHAAQHVAVRLAAYHHGLF